ncbi:Peptidase M20 domain-containing protein 2 [Colletotrichum tanaceti]|uniref:Peptidase M20 domain-containing protein 2 n=1 Tax=Colletotrichum tanaceti TaxID=1306861 RepID=A0A4U6X393_9PEZI|nr:Peptidase M20 domain-containing protein 2 [Colletotrichum tanaceti]TKW49841.1 Peptidase M20 domain-containing protein 2 [Colletotrichum tanaceti]
MRCPRYQSCRCRFILQFIKRSLTLAMLVVIILLRHRLLRRFLEVEAAGALSDQNIPGSLRNDGGIEAKPIKAGAFTSPEDTAAAIMAHPTTAHQGGSGHRSSGLTGFELIASHKFRVEFCGKPAHAVGAPWKGLNALDAAVAANVALLRQLIQSDERTQGVIEVEGTVPTVIAEFGRVNRNVRGPTIDRAHALLQRVKAYLEAGVAANDWLLANSKIRAWRQLGKQPDFDTGQDRYAHDSPADIGNVSYLMPSFYGVSAIPTSSDAAGYDRKFTAAAATDEEHAAAFKCAEGMAAMLALGVLISKAISNGAREDFTARDKSNKL